MCVVAFLFILVQLSLKKETHDFSSSVLALGFVMSHHSVWRRDHEVPELPRRQDILTQLHDPAHGDIKSRGNDTTLVDAPYEVDNNFSCTMIIYDFKVTNVLVLLHELEELDDDL